MFHIQHSITPTPTPTPNPPTPSSSSTIHSSQQQQQQHDTYTTPVLQYSQHILAQLAQEENHGNTHTHRHHRHTTQSARSHRHHHHQHEHILHPHTDIKSKYTTTAAASASSSTIPIHVATATPTPQPLYTPHTPSVSPLSANIFIPTTSFVHPNTLTCFHPMEPQHISPTTQQQYESVTAQSDLFTKVSHLSSLYQSLLTNYNNLFLYSSNLKSVLQRQQSYHSQSFSTYKYHHKLKHSIFYFWYFLYFNNKHKKSLMYLKQQENMDKAYIFYRNICDKYMYSVYIQIRSLYIAKVERKKKLYVLIDKYHNTLPKKMYYNKWKTYIHHHHIYELHHQYIDMQKNFNNLSLYYNLNNWKAYTTTTSQLAHIYNHYRLHKMKHKIYQHMKNIVMINHIYDNIHKYIDRIQNKLMINSIYQSWKMIAHHRHKLYNHQQHRILFIMNILNKHLHKRINHKITLKNTLNKWRYYNTCMVNTILKNDIVNLHKNIKKINEQHNENMDKYICNSDNNNKIIINENNTLKYEISLYKHIISVLDSTLSCDIFHLFYNNNNNTGNIGNIEASLNAHLSGQVHPHHHPSSSSSSSSSLPYSVHLPMTLFTPPPTTMPLSSPTTSSVPSSLSPSSLSSSSLHLQSLLKGLIEKNINEKFKHLQQDILNYEEKCKKYEKTIEDMNIAHDQEKSNMIQQHKNELTECMNNYHEKYKIIKAKKNKLKVDYHQYKTEKESMINQLNDENEQLKQKLQDVLQRNRVLASALITRTSSHNTNNIVSDGMIMNDHQQNHDIPLAPSSPLPSTSQHHSPYFSSIHNIERYPNLLQLNGKHRDHNDNHHNHVFNVATDIDADSNMNNPVARTSSTSTSSTLFSPLNVTLKFPPTSPLPPSPPKSPFPTLPVHSRNISNSHTNSNHIDQQQPNNNFVVADLDANVEQKEFVL